MRRMLLGVAIVGTLILANVAASQEGDGYRLNANRVEVSTRLDWETWDVADGAAVIEADGTVRPRFLRRDINASLNADEFRYVSQGDTLTGGVHIAGSNANAASLVMDGDPSTSWEPDPESSVSSWFVEVDLGRVVMAERIVVRFAEEGFGDPFLKFRVMASSGLTSGQWARGWGYFRVGLRTQPNRTERVFEYGVEAQRRMPPGVSGEPVQFVRFEALDSMGPRGAEVRAEEHGELPAADQGAIDYYRRTVAGRQIRVKEADYLRLPPEEQGEVRHYRRERPRLAELEVYALGDNAIRATRPKLDPGIRTSAAEIRMRTYTDGRHTSYQAMAEYNEVRDENRLEIDLGARYWLDRVRWLSPAHPPPAYQIRVADGSLNPNGQRIWRIFPERQNAEAYQHVEESFSLRKVRYIDLRRPPWPAGRREYGYLSEVLAFGEGFASEVVLTSPLIKLGRSRLFTTVTWEGHTQGHSRVEVRTRTGDELLRIPHYYHPRGSETSRRVWERLPADERPPVVVEELPGSDWSPWSESHRQSGERFKSPSPRRYAMVQVRLLSTDSLDGAEIRHLGLHFVPPLVDGAWAEIWPKQGIRPGEEEKFTLYVRPLFAAYNPGFDRLRLASSSTEPIEVLSVRAGSDQALRRGTARQLWPGPAQVETDGAGAATVVLAAPVRGGSDIYAIHFRTRVFLSNTLFSVQLSRQALPGRAQEVAAGEASTLVPSQSLFVLTDVVDTPLLGRLEVVPPVFTPNGDGVNDAAAIELDVYVIEAEREVSVRIHDLHGRRVRELSLQTAHPSGGHRIMWNGCGDGGGLLPPGIYVVKAGFATDAAGQKTTGVRLVHLVY